MTTTRTTHGRRRLLARLLSGLGLGYGLTLLTRPGRVVAALCPEYPSSRTWAIRLLGGRLIIQHAVLLAAPARRTLLTAAAVDAIHAVTMVPLLRSRRYGRAAAISGGVAAAYAAAAQVLGPRSESR